jgi:D-glycero-alpha-D-manno-heptose-7-phosphate kinase
MIVVKTPLRISFVGGGTDLEDFYCQYPGRVISTSIDKAVYITVSEKFSGDIRVSYSDTEIVGHRKEVKHTRVKAILEKLDIEKGVEIVSIADLPSEGTGMASSSAFTVGLLKALYSYKGQHVAAEQLAHQACEVEIGMLKEPIGKQDQYAVACGGLNMITFNPDGSVKVDPIHLDPTTKEQFQQHLMFFYTAKTRSAGSVLTEQKNNITAKFEVLKKMSDMVPVFYEMLEQGDFKSMGELLHEAWMLKRELSSGISNSEIDTMYETALSHGAWGGKILGAGGGGFLMLFVPPEEQDNVRFGLSAWREVKFRFSEGGSKIVYQS